jgi:hypothetical protein
MKMRRAFPAADANMNVMYLTLRNLADQWNTFSVQEVSAQSLSIAMEARYKQVLVSLTCSNRPEPFEWLQTLCLVAPRHAYP